MCVDNSAEMSFCLETNNFPVESQHTLRKLHFMFDSYIRPDGDHAILLYSGNEIEGKLFRFEPSSLQ